MQLSQLIEANSYTTRNEVCPGCENHCQVKLFTFANGKTFASGNNCEKIYSSQHESHAKGINMLQEKYRLLFSKAAVESQKTKDRPAGSKTLSTFSEHSELSFDFERSGLTIGIPRGLGIYENWVFWRTMFARCGIKTVLSGGSTVKMYEKGVRTIMADNICFPAKLMHGHVMDLIERKVDRIFYPFVVFEQKEDARSRNSFNCPIVSAYSDVLKSSIDPERNYGIPLDAPVVSFQDEQMLTASCTEYLATLGIPSREAKRAVEAATRAQKEYIDTLERRGLEVLSRAKAEGRMVIMLAGRPYHTDPLIEHKISNAIAEMGVDMITEHAAIHSGQEVYGELNAVTQWAYPNRVFKAAYFVGTNDYEGLHMVQLTSFGCGPDAFILDEVQAILGRYHKNLTILKIDDVNNIGSLKLRVRSLVESTTRTKDDVRCTKTQEPDPFLTTRPFGEEDRRKTIIAPYFAEGYSEFLPAIFELAGYRLVNLPMGNQEDAEAGLRYANNDVCYPATIVIGSIMNALNSGTYDLQNTAVIITQTGGQCRATNYYSLIKNAMIRAGYTDVPLLSLATGEGVENDQPGFRVEWRKLARTAVHTMAYADALNKLYHSAAVRSREDAATTAITLREQYIRLGSEAIRANRPGQLLRLIGQATADFASIIDPDKQVPVIGLVGEIYVKYNSFSHKNVVNWLLQEGVEVVPPSIMDFFSTSFVSRHANRELHIKRESVPAWLTDLLYRYVRRVAKQYDRTCNIYPFYRPSSDIFEIARLSKQVISTAADFGEGWMLPGEICHLAQSGVSNIISLQPFGCIANHIISKGIEKKLRGIYPHVNMLFLDFDSSTSDANIYNRLHFLVNNAKHENI
ncbi:MAG: 2-hydroxyacyl-CoA dehydratase [Paludibacteraceae bacterium]|nr:2-hydroxyacyl-CoA dehydratase [Paludibacteraceae bacterium]